MRSIPTICHRDGHPSGGRSYHDSVTQRKSERMSLITESDTTELVLDLTRPRWMERAICAGHTELFFAPHAERPPARLRR
ncbi:hypothetical protein BH24ACT4_BH24ACT4_26680 [soil metagenome]